jgi:hypothetical protein
MDFGDSDTGFIISEDTPPGTPLFNFFNESNLVIETVDGHLKVSTQIRDPSGDLVAELIKNEWKVALPPKTWDRNYTDDALEVKNVGGRVVLQVRALPDRIQLQGEWWSKNGFGVRFVKVSDPATGKPTGAIQRLSAALNPDEPRIEALFEYPSDSHFGQLRKPK